MRTICQLICTTLLAAACAHQETVHTIDVIATGDVHGAYFDEPYVSGRTRTSLMSVSAWVDSVRNARGKDNVILLDVGDCLQGDNAAYYYNNVDTIAPHLFPRLASYMGYDAAVVGNHDIETGHRVYDRVAAQMKKERIPWLCGNAICPNGKPYFKDYTILHRAGLKVAVLGFGNANISAWLSPELWSGMHFESLLPLVQQRVDAVIASEHPQVVIVAVHSGTGEGDGTQLENQGLDLLNSLQGVDLIIGAHDHIPYVQRVGDCLYVDGGARGGYVSHATISLLCKGRKILEKHSSAEFCRMDKSKINTEMQERFRPEFEAVKAFTCRKVGTLEMPLLTREAYAGMCSYLDLVHTVQLCSSGCDISFAAPLTFNGKVAPGELVFNDMFTIYPFENQLFVLSLKGSEIKDYLEYSYGIWVSDDPLHVLNIVRKSDPRTGAMRWSFVNRSYNFDSAAGINYTVDITKPKGSRVNILSMADGTPFDESAFYKVAMTSYRANGGGDLLIDGAHIAKEDIDARIVARCPEIRSSIYDFIVEHGIIDSLAVSDRSRLGSWRFVPEEIAAPAIEKDMELLF